MPLKHSWLTDTGFRRAYNYLSPILLYNFTNSQDQADQGNGMKQEGRVLLLSEEEITGQVSNMIKISLPELYLTEKKMLLYADSCYYM